MDFNELANQYYDRLNATDMHILKYITQNKSVCSGLSIEQMARNCNVSRSTILRFAQKLSFSGYSELKVHLKWEANNKNGLSDRNILDMISNDYSSVIEDMKAKDCSQICSAIQSADNVYIYGTGSVQGSVAEQFQRMLLDVGRSAISFKGSAEIKKVLRILTPRDFVILISLSGESDNIVNFAKNLASKGIPTLSITKLNKNELARLSTYNIYMTSSRICFNSIVELETTALFFIIIEMLTIKYSLFVTEHPAIE